jgi:hypothetical protein
MPLFIHEVVFSVHSAVCVPFPITAVNVSLLVSRCERLYSCRTAWWIICKRSDEDVNILMARRTVTVIAAVIALVRFYCLL